MTSLLVTTIVYYNDVIKITKYDSTFVSDSPKIVQLDNKMSFDALKRVIGNNISLPNGEVVKDIHFFISYIICWWVHDMYVARGWGCNDYVFHVCRHLQAHMPRVVN